MLSVRHKFFPRNFHPQRANALVFTVEKNVAGKVISTSIGEKTLPLTSEKFLAESYKILDCNLIEMVDVEIKDKVYTIICDEEFLEKPHPVATLYVEKFGGRDIICNSFMIVHYTYNEKTGREELENLSRIDIRRIREYIDQSQIKLKIYFAMQGK